MHCVVFIVAHAKLLQSSWSHIGKSPRDVIKFIWCTGQKLLTDHPTRLGKIQILQATFFFWFYVVNRKATRRGYQAAMQLTFQVEAQWREREIQLHKLAQQMLQNIGL